MVCKFFLCSFYNMILPLLVLIQLSLTFLLLLQFLLEDARTKTSSTTDNNSAFIRRPPTSNSNALMSANSLSTDTTGEATVTVPLRRQAKPEDKEDKENDSRSAIATQAVIQRRRKPKRRSTGVVHLDLDVNVSFF